MSYKVLSPIRANGTLYTVGESFPDKLKKVNYEDLLSGGYLELAQNVTKVPVTATPRIADAKNEPKKPITNTKSEK